ncbi:MAG: HEPN domain-containing protein [Opitutales bacterium]
MNEISREWIAKAEGDRVTALRELRARNAPNYDAACFHAQQAVEKIMKAFMIDHQIGFKRTHDLEILLDACLSAEPILEGLRPEAQLLTQYAVQFRYPGESADKAEAKQATQAMQCCWDNFAARFR